MYKAFPYEKTSVRTKLYKCFYVFISYRERISFISDAAPRRLTSKCACGRVLFKSQLLTLGYFCFGYRPVGSYIFFGNRSHVGASFVSLAPIYFIDTSSAAGIQNFIAARLGGYFYTISPNKILSINAVCSLRYFSPKSAYFLQTLRKAPVYKLNCLLQFV